MGPDYRLGGFSSQHARAWYGYYFDPDVLVSYAIRYIPDDFLYLWKDSKLWLMAIDMLAEEAGLTTLPQAEIAVVDMDARWEVPVRSRGAVMEPVGETCMIIPLFTNDKFSMMRRPTQSQVDFISEVLGQEPRWWEGTDYVYRPKEAEAD